MNSDNKRLFSVSPIHYQQAQQTAEQRSKTFKNWQAVIRLAISYGLPLVGRAVLEQQIRASDHKGIQRREKATKDTKLDNTARRAINNRVCAYGGLPSCKTLLCKNCKDSIAREHLEYIKKFG